MAQKSSALHPTGLHNLRAYQLAKQLAHLIYDVTTSPDPLQDEPDA